jgi:hypothetical protein
VDLPPQWRAGRAAGLEGAYDSPSATHCRAADILVQILDLQPEKHLLERLAFPRQPPNNGCGLALPTMAWPAR